MIDETLADPDAQDRRALLQVLSLAFRDNPMNIAIHGPRPAKRVRANRAGLRGLVLDTAGETCTRVVRHQNRVVGGFVAVPPGRFPLDAQSMGRQIGCLFGQGFRAMRDWGAVTSELGLHHPNSPHWYLAVLGVEPEFQGQGFGNQLLQALFRMMKDDPAFLYLESDRPASVDFYLGRGFSICTETKLIGVDCWCLARRSPDVDEDLCDSVREF